MRVHFWIYQLHQNDPRRTQIVDGHIRMAVLCVIQDSHFVVIEVNLVDHFGFADLKHSLTSWHKYR